MTTKIRIKVGAVEVDYEGAEAFLNKKLPDLISQLSTLAEQVPEANDGGGGSGGGGGGAGGGGKVGTLASFLKEAKVGNSATKRFLATAEWLHRKGTKELKTSDVTTAIRTNHQTRLGNASQCLNNNVNSGFCEKHGKTFYVTDEGRATLK